MDRFVNPLALVLEGPGRAKPGGLSLLPGSYEIPGREGSGGNLRSYRAAASMLVIGI